MPELQHVAAQHGPGCDQRLLRRAPGVARQEQVPLAHPDPEHERALVARRCRFGRSRRPERRDREIAAPPDRVARAPLPHRHAALRRFPPQPREVRVVPGAVGEPELTDGERREHRDEAAPVVEVGVGRDGDVDPCHAERAQRRRNHEPAEVRALGERAAGVHQECRVASLHERRIALPHVEEHGSRPRRRTRGGWNERREDRRRERHDEPHAHAPSASQRVAGSISALASALP